MLGFTKAENVCIKLSVDFDIACSVSRGLIYITVEVEAWTLPDDIWRSSSILRPLLSVV